MKYYLIDASSYVKWAIGNPILKIDFMKEHTKGEAFLYMPQFCVAEVMTTFSKLYYFQEGKEKIAKPRFKELCSAFARHIHDRSKIYIYDLHRYHNITAEKDGIFTKVFEINENIGVFDILIIAMAMELKSIYKGKNDEIIILSEDRGLRTVAQALKIKAESISTGGAK